MYLSYRRVRSAGADTEYSFTAPYDTRSSQQRKHELTINLQMLEFLWWRVGPARASTAMSIAAFGARTAVSSGSVRWDVYGRALK